MAQKTFPDGQTHHRYDVRSEEGYWLATVFVGADGVFSTVSDYGNYGYWWSSIGGDGDIRRFLLNSERDPDYFRLKFDPSDVYDGQATEAAIRKYILECRREGTLTKEEAREEWEHASAAATDWRDWYSDTHLECDPHDLYYDKPAPQPVAFVQKVMPRLCAMLRAELDAERKAA